MMKKVSLSILLFVLVSMMIFAGGSKESQSSDNGVVELRVLNYIDMSEPNSANEVEKVWDNFTNTHPDIKIVREDLFNEPFHQKTEAYVASGNVPDVVYMWPTGRSTSLQTTGSVKDLMPLLKKDNLVDNYNPAILAPQAAGFLAELANGFTATHMLYVNEKVLRENGLEMPKTFDEMKAMVAPLKAKGIELIGMDNQSAWVMQSCFFSTVVGRYGGPDWYNELVAGKIKFTDSWFVKSLDLINEMYESGMINRNTLNSPYGSGRANFAAGKCAFFIDGDWSTAAFQTDITTGQSLLSREQQQNNVALTIIPELPGEKYHGTNAGIVGTGFGMSANIESGSKKEAAAWELIKYLQGEYVQTYRLTTGASFPSNVKIDVDEVVKENDLEPLVAKRSEFYKLPTAITPVIDGVVSPEVTNVINTGLQEIGLGSKTPMQVAQETQKAYEEWKSEN